MESMYTCRTDAPRIVGGSEGGSRASKMSAGAWRAQKFTQRAMQYTMAPHICVF